MQPLNILRCSEWGLQPVEEASATHLDEGLPEDGRFRYVDKRVGPSGILKRGTKISRPSRSIPQARKSHNIRIGKPSAREQAEMSKRSRITEGNWHPYSERYVPVPFRYHASRRGQGTTSAERRGLSWERRGAMTRGARTRYMWMWKRTRHGNN